ncbi:MAG: glycoside hydrolase family 3 protein [Alphaproteobacteria bacterium]|nr:glycoside hydrolase family 3 protein [Alphaproteobacteria bacterium]
MGVGRLRETGNGVRDLIHPSRRHVLAGAAALLAASPFQAHARAIEAMSLSEKLGHMLLMGFIGSTPQTAGADIIEAHLAERRIGGVLFLRHNVRSSEGAEGLAARFRAVAPQAWMALDQEGGLVQRLSRDLGYTWIPRAMQVVEERGLAGAEMVYGIGAREFTAAGFNMNLAPVADLHDPDNAVIGRYGRAYGTDGEAIAAYASRFVDAFRDAGAVCVVKHFPGHGRSRGDSHDGFVDITETWSQAELDPFRRLIASGHAPMIMGGHLTHQQLDPTGVPVTFSAPILNGILREEMRYQGVIMTDDLDMGAIRENYDQRDAVLRSIEAGNDIIMLSNSAAPNMELPQTILRWVEEAMEAGRFDEARIDRSVARILAARIA